MTRLLIVIAAADQARANTDALAFDPAGGDRTFTVGLSPTGALPATHYWCSSIASEATAAAVAAKLTAEYAGAICEEWDMDANPGRPEQLLAALGLQTLRGDRA